MQFTYLAVTLPLLGFALADLHQYAVCVTGRTYSESGGTPFSPSQTWAKQYEILPGATKCACDYYRNRHKGNEHWNSCPDCYFDGLQCVSNDWHIGGDEITYYCEKLCGSQGAEAN
ncbi:hypothetical protein DM02DRAFT_575219 [Periconia macrospinosa]|uniref:Uncharacterized protein n=1 Tax=Periconia macrospinosa TaxID=97972 RepID=A0A2V1D496_9PLEO|nr:hypothetical protein DM02DRAFT_575219 [Periconia macrospinosa]